MYQQPHVRHIYAKADDMVKSKICAYSQSDHAQLQWKCVMQCCSKRPSINLPHKEKYDQYPNTSHSVRFNIYHIIARCTKHGKFSVKRQENMS